MGLAGYKMTGITNGRLLISNLICLKDGVAYIFVFFLSINRYNIQHAVIDDKTDSSEI